jgi:hypothetical protein
MLHGCCVCNYGTYIFIQMICWSVPALIAYIYYVKYLSHFMFVYYICRSAFSKTGFLYIYESCSLFYCCVYVVGVLEVYCREAKYGKLVNVEGWGSIGGLQSNFYDGMKDHTGKNSVFVI